MSDVKLVKYALCPYCQYEITCSETIGKEKHLPKPGDLSFCLMCCEAMEFDKNLNFKKFDLNSVSDPEERNYYKSTQDKMKKAWEEMPQMQPHRARRQKFLDNMKRG